MNHIRKKLSIAFFIATPFLATVLLIRTGSLLLILLIYFISFVGLIIFTIQLSRRAMGWKNKVIPPLVAVSAVVLFFALRGELIYAGDYIFYKVREDHLKKLVSEIKSYQKIHEMSDGERYWKTLNDQAFVYNSKNLKGDIFYSSGDRKLFKDVLIEQQVDFSKYKKFRKGLIDAQLIGFTTLEDGTISFTNDGMLDNCYGLAYSETGIAPKYNDCGEIIFWKQVGKNWYAWTTT